LHLARIDKVSGVADGDEGGGVVEVKYAVGWLRSIDTAQEFDIFVVVGSWKVAREVLVERLWAILGVSLH
jgi:hypothetical protein